MDIIIKFVSVVVACLVYHFFIHDRLYFWINPEDK